MYLLGYDIGSSSVKASLADVQSGKCAATAFYPKTEAREGEAAELEPAVEMVTLENSPMKYEGADLDAYLDSILTTYHLYF